jgi:hypothetical protein
VRRSGHTPSEKLSASAPAAVSGIMLVQLQAAALCSSGQHRPHAQREAVRLSTCTV